MRKAFISRIPHIGRPISMPSLSKHVGTLSETADPHRAIFHTTGVTFLSKLDHDEEALYRLAGEWRKRSDRWAERQSHRLDKLDIYTERRIGRTVL